MEECHQRCSETEIALLKPMVEIESNETIRLICRDADTIVIEVQTNIKLKSTDTHFTGELYIVKYQESGNRSAPKMFYVVREKRECFFFFLREETRTHFYNFHIRQSDSAYVTIENLAVNTSYSASVSIVDAMRQYRHLTHMIDVRTLPNKSYRPATISKESIIVSDFTIDEDPNKLAAYVQWSPADGLCIDIDTFNFFYEFITDFHSFIFYSYFLRYGLSIWNDFI